MSKTESSSVTKNKLTPGASHRDDRATTPGTDDESTVGPICENFAPQTWRKTICRNCFHAKTEHGSDTRTNGTENLANSADARKTTSKKEEEKEKSSDKNVSSTTEKSKNTAQAAAKATVKEEEETKNTKPLAALLASNQPKKSPHVIPNATPVSLIMSNLANSKKPSPVDVKKCGPPGNTLLSTASAKKLVEKFGGSKTAPPSPSGPGPNKLPIFGKKTNSFLKETPKSDAPSPGTKQVASALASTKSSKTSDVVSTSAGTTSTPSSSLSSTSSSHSTTKTTSVASNKDTPTTKDSTIDTKKSSSDSSSTATSTSKTATAPSTSSATTTSTKPTTTTTTTKPPPPTTTTTKPSTTTSESANDKSKISSASTTPTSTKISTGDTSKATATSSTVPPSSTVASKGQVGSSSSTSTTSTPAIKTPVVTVAASDDKNAASEKTASKAKTRSPSPSFLSASSSAPASPSPPSPTPSTSLAAPPLSSSTKTTAAAASTSTTPSTTTKPSLSMPPSSPSTPSTPLSPSSPVSPSPKTTTATHAKPTSTPPATSATPATSVQQTQSTSVPTTTAQKGVNPSVSKTTTTTATTLVTASDKTTTTTTAVTTTKTTPTATTTTTTAKTTTTSSVPSSTPAISTKPTTHTSGTTTTTATTTTMTKTTDPKQTTKTAATAPTSLGPKFTGQLTDTLAPTSPIPKVKTMVVESSKYAKSQAEAAAAAAAAEAAATAAALAVAATKTTTPLSTPISTPTTLPPPTTTQSTKEEITDYGDYGDNTASMRRTSRYTDDPHVGSTRTFTSATSDEVKNDGQRCIRSHSFEGANVIITSGQDNNEGMRDSPGRLSRQDSTSSTSSSSESGRSRQPIVVEVQVRKGHRSSQPSSQPTGRSPSPAPFVVISPGGATRVGRTPITTTIRTGFGFPSGRMSPSVLHSGFSGLGGYIEGLAGERSWDSGGGGFVSSPSASSCSSPIPSSMRSGYRPYQSPSPSPSPSTPARVIPLPVLHTTSTGVSPDSYEFNVARATSPHIAGYHTPPPPPYTPPLDTPTTPSRTSSTSPSQQFYSPGPTNIQDGKASGSHYLKDVDYDLDTRFDPNNLENKLKHDGGKSRDVLVIDNRITRDKDNQQARPNTYVQQVSGYSPSVSQQQAENASVICHHNETNIDASQPAAVAAAAAAAAAVSRYPGKDNITQASSTDAVVSPSSPAASTAVAAPPASISNEGRQEAHSLKAVPCENRDQEPRKSYHETPDDQSKSKGGQSRSPAEISHSETNRGLSFEEVEKINSKVAELEECVQKLKDENSKLQNDLNEKSIVEKQVVEYTETLKTMEKKCTDLEEDKKELEDQVQIEKMKVAKGQLESRSLAELRKLLDESDETRLRLNDENNTLREEVNEMKLEVDEMYDQFRESDAEDFRELQKELEITAKNCRILQFKLRKAERRNDQIETEREHYEDKLRNLQDAFESQDARRHIQALEEELKMAKEVSVRLHDELDIVEEKRSRVEDDNRKLQDMLELSDKKNFRMEMEIDKLRDKVGDLQSAMAKVANGTQDSSSNRKRYQY